jgi:hypothetical protein
MGRHDADPRERLRYVIVALAVVAVIALLVVGVFAVTDLTGH